MPTDASFQALTDTDKMLLLGEVSRRRQEDFDLIKAVTDSLKSWINPTAWHAAKEAEANKRENALFDQMESASRYTGGVFVMPKDLRETIDQAHAKGAVVEDGRLVRMSMDDWVRMSVAGQAKAQG